MYKKNISIAIFILLIVIFLFFKNSIVTYFNSLLTNEANKSVVQGIISNVIYGLIILFIISIRKELNRLIFTYFLQGKSITEEKERVEFERIYLQNFIERLKSELPWELKKYTELNIYDEELNINVNKVKPRLWHLPDSNESQESLIIKNTKSLQSYLKKVKGPIMLKGNPGSGKTMALRKFSYDTAKKSLKNLSFNVKIPIYINLNAYKNYTNDLNPESFYDFINSYLKKEFPYADYIREHFSDYLIKGRIIFVLDGLNELPPDEFTIRYKLMEEFIFKKFPKNKYVISCRNIRHTSIFKFKTIEINELSDEQIRLFIKSYKGNDFADSIFSELTTGEGFMLRICRNPYMLHMLVNRSADRNLPETQAMLFDEYCYDRIKLFTDDTEVVVKTLSEIAYKIQEKGMFAGDIEIDNIINEFGNLNINNLLSVSKKANLIDCSVTGRFRFYHQILQEYFAALKIKEIFEKSSKIRYIDDPKWEETIIVCSGIVQEPEKFIKEIYDTSKTDQYFLNLSLKATGQCGLKISDSFFNVIIDNARKILLNENSCSIINKIETIKALSYIENSKTLKLITDVALSYKGWIQELALQIICKSRHPNKNEYIEQALKKLQSFRILMEVKPFIRNNNLIKFFIKSFLTFDIISKIFWNTWQYLFILAPFLLYSILFKISKELHVNYAYIIGVLLALTFLIQFLIANKKGIKSIINTKMNLRKLSIEIKTWFSWIHLLIIGAIVAIVLYPLHIFLFFAILMILGIYLLIIYDTFTFIKNLLNPKKLVHFIFRSKLYIILFFIFLATILIDRYFPEIRTIPVDSGIPKIKEDFLTSFFLKCFFYILYPPIFKTIRILVMILSVFSFIVHTVIYLNFLKLITKKRKFIRKGDFKYLDSLIKSIQSSFFNPVKIFAIRITRRISLPERYIKIMENITDDSEQVMNEIERTIYELRIEGREQSKFN